MRRRPYTVKRGVRSKDDCLQVAGNVKRGTADGRLRLTSKKLGASGVQQHACSDWKHTAMHGVLSVSVLTFKDDPARRGVLPSTVQRYAHVGHLRPERISTASVLSDP